MTKTMTNPGALKRNESATSATPTSSAAQAARDLKYEQSPLKIDYAVKDLVRMNLNENLVLPQTFLRSVSARCLDRFSSRHYPSELNEGEMLALKVEIARYCRCTPEMVCFGNGSDQLIDLLFRMKLRSPGDALVTIDPTFSLYAIMARRMGAEVLQVPVKPLEPAADGGSASSSSFALDTDEVVRACKPNDHSRAKKKKTSPRVLALASPNNPTGVQYPLEQIKHIIESLPEITVLLDEAYVEYASYEATKLLGSYRNLIIMRTFSKAFALASHRLGYLLSSDPDFVRSFEEEFQYPYPVAEFGVLMATELLKQRDTVLQWAKRTTQLRSELLGGIEGLGVKRGSRKGMTLRATPNSEANFLLVKTSAARSIASELLEKYRIAVKLIDRIGPQSGFLRITVGSGQLNEKLLYALRRIAANGDFN